MRISSTICLKFQSRQVTNSGYELETLDFKVHTLHHSATTLTAIGLALTWEGGVPRMFWGPRAKVQVIVHVPYIKIVKSYKSIAIYKLMYK